MSKIRAFHLNTGQLAETSFHKILKLCEAHASNLPYMYTTLSTKATHTAAGVSCAEYFTQKQMAPQTRH